MHDFNAMMSRCKLTELTVTHANSDDFPYTSDELALYMLHICQQLDVEEEIQSQISSLSEHVAYQEKFESVDERALLGIKVGEEVQEPNQISSLMEQPEFDERDLVENRMREFIDDFIQPQPDANQCNGQRQEEAYDGQNKDAEEDNADEEELDEILQENAQVFIFKKEGVKANQEVVITQSQTVTIKKQIIRKPKTPVKNKREKIKK